MFAAILSVLKTVWTFVQKNWVAIISFGATLVSWFVQNPQRNAAVSDPNKLAVSIKAAYDAGEYTEAVINTVVDTKDPKNWKIDNPDQNIQQNLSNALDAETRSRLDAKAMIVYRPQQAVTNRSLESPEYNVVGI
jgi:hypothetical protein